MMGSGKSSSVAKQLLGGTTYAWNTPVVVRISTKLILSTKHVLCIINSGNKHDSGRDPRQAHVRRLFNPTPTAIALLWTTHAHSAGTDASASSSCTSAPSPGAAHRGARDRCLDPGPESRHRSQMRQYPVLRRYGRTYSRLDRR